MIIKYLKLDTSSIENEVIFMSSIDYAYKAKILKTNLCRDISKIDKARYLKEAQGLIIDKSFDYDFEEMMLYQEQGYSDKDIKEARNINRASHYRKERLEARISNYLSQGQCIFVTLTFNNYVLERTNEETRRKYVRRYLRSQSACYVANIDYGKTNEREHYHAVVLGDRLNMSEWHYGYIYVERVKNHLKTSLKLSKYVTKLCNHAIKETTKRSVYIYSRDITKLMTSDATHITPRLESTQTW